MEVLQTSALPLGHGAKTKGGDGRFLTDSPPRAGNRTRTGDPNLGKVVLYQLSYSRMGLGEPGKCTRFVFKRFLPTPKNYKS
jgi:hypothetical protein